MQTKSTRRSIRLDGYDYSQEGFYFITICTQDKIHRFGRIENGQMQLNNIGDQADHCWNQIPLHFPLVKIHEYVIMPNHIHVIIEIVGAIPCGCPLPSPDRFEDDGIRPNRAAVKAAPTALSEIVGSYKSLVFKNCLTFYKSNNQTMGKLWQRNYYEHIIRDGNDHARIVDYIHNNPLNWETDKYF